MAGPEAPRKPGALRERHVVLVVSGGIAAYKSLELVRLLRERGARVSPLLTPHAAHFVTPLSLAALSESEVYGDGFSIADAAAMRHITLTRDADLVIVAPATANILAKMAAGIADDLATTALLACTRPLLVAPAMNVAMWRHPATVRNLATLAERGVATVGPASGELACGDQGTGRMAEPAEIVAAIEATLAHHQRLSGRRALVTSGPTREPIDPVRYLVNRSSGRQGHAVAGALAELGAETLLVSGPTSLPDPPGTAVVRVETAREMLDACRAALPVDVVVCAAAVADWRPESASPHKIKKGPGEPPVIRLTTNPDVLASLAAGGDQRPALVVGFAAETENLLDNARAKLRAKGCDWIVANDVSGAVFGGERNRVTLLVADAAEEWPELDKCEVARRLAERIADALEGAGPPA